MAAFLDNVRFNPTLGGTTDWTYSSAVAGYQSPTAAGAVTTTVYEVFAIDASNNWEIARGACTITTGIPTFARTTVLSNSAGTGTAAGQSGAGTKISFAAAPQVAVVAIKESLISPDEANSFTTTQQAQLRTNIGLGSVSPSGTNIGINNVAPGAPFQVGDSSIVNASGRIRSSTHDSGGGGRDWDFGADFATFGGYGWYIKDVGAAAIRFSIDLVGTTVLPNFALKGYLFGLTLSTAGSSANFAVSAGEAADSTNTQRMIVASALTKSTSVWAVGTSAGALDTGTIANSTWYHVHAIKRTDTGVVDVLFSLSATAPTMPTSYTLFRRIGSMKTDGSAHWTAFTQTGDIFSWAVPVQDISALSFASTNYTAHALTTPPGVKTLAKLLLYTTSTGGVAFVSPDSGTAGSAIVNTGYNMLSTSQTASGTEVLTDTSSQILIGSTATGGATYVSTYGFTDKRGRDA